MDLATQRFAYSGRERTKQSKYFHLLFALTRPLSFRYKIVRIISLFRTGRCSKKKKLLLKKENPVLSSTIGRCHTFPFLQADVIFVTMRTATVYFVNEFIEIEQNGRELQTTQSDSVG